MIDLTGTSVEISLIPTVEFLQAQSDFYWGGSSSTLTMCLSSFGDFSTIAQGSSVYFNEAGSSVLLSPTIGRKRIQEIEFDYSQTIPALTSSTEEVNIPTSRRNPKSFYIKNTYKDNSNHVVLMGTIDNQSITELAPLLTEATTLSEKFLNTTTEQYFICFASGVSFSYTESELGYIVGMVDKNSLETSTSLTVPAIIECNQTAPEFTATTKAGSGSDFAYFDTIYLKNSEDVLFLGRVPDVVFLYTDKSTVHNASISIKTVSIKQELSWQTIIL